MENDLFSVMCEMLLIYTISHFFQHKTQRVKFKRKTVEIRYIRVTIVVLDFIGIEVFLLEWDMPRRGL